MICPMADLSIPAAVANTSTAIISPTSYAKLPIMSRTAECKKIWKTLLFWAYRTRNRTLAGLFWTYLIPARAYLFYFQFAESDSIKKSCFLWLGISFRCTYFRLRHCVCDGNGELAPYWFQCRRWERKNHPKFGGLYQAMACRLWEGFPKPLA